MGPRVALAMLACLAASLVAAPVGGAAPSVPTAPATVDGGVYLVVLRDRPLATYAGRIPGLRSTAPSGAHRLRSGTAAAVAYRHYLLRRQQRVLDQIGDPATLYSYVDAVSGFAALLTPTQVKQLQGDPRVIAVEADAVARLDGNPGLARRAAPVASSAHLAGRAAATTGRGVVIGVIDSGVWPDNPSFAAEPLDPVTRQSRYPGFTGRCSRGERWTSATCNAKIIAARYFLAGFGADRLAASEFASARDGSGHGSHTASVAAGNAGVDVRIDGQSFGHISGVAPGAALAIYKACWAAPDPDDDGCTTADALKAIDVSVGDGVDVISYSIGATGHGVDDIIDGAFLNAAAAGVFVATSAGDDGPRAGTVGHTSPWVTTVAATTRSAFRGSVRLGDGESFRGAMASDRVVRSVRLIDARDAAARHVGERRAALCSAGSLDARRVDGSVVLCRRGSVARVEKSDEVARAGGVAMILVNQIAGDTDPDVHAVPTVHLDVAAGRAVEAYLSSATRPTASLVPDTAASAGRASVADFSSRGPSAGADRDVLKPDVAAPGGGVVAAVAPPSNSGRLWDVYSGTSMAAPQVAGLAALVGAAHPRWSPAVIKSALVTTATALPHAGAFAAGAGEIAPRRALDPGLAYAATSADWRRRPASGSSDVNGPSIAISELVGDRDVRRVVTNVSRRTETYRVQVTGLSGVGVAVSPSSFTLAPGRSRPYTVSFSSRRSARYGAWSEGALTWYGSLGHRVASAIAVRPEYVRAPSELRVSGRHGTARLRALAGVTGTVRTSVLGPVAADELPLRLVPGAFDSTEPARSPSAQLRRVHVPGDTALVRFAVHSRRADLDLYVYRGRRLVAAATGTGHRELVTLAAPAAGRYDVYVNAAPSPSRHQRAVVGRLTSWVLPRTRARGMTVSPGAVDVTGDETFRLDVRWRRLAEGRRWLAAVSYEDSSALTVVTVN